MLAPSAPMAFPETRGVTLMATSVCAAGLGAQAQRVPAASADVWLGGDRRRTVRVSGFPALCEWKSTLNGPFLTPTVPTSPGHNCGRAGRRPVGS